MNLPEQKVPAMHIISHIQRIESYILLHYTLGAALQAIQDDIMHAIVSLSVKLVHLHRFTPCIHIFQSPSLHKCIITRNECVTNIYESTYNIQHSLQLVERISKLHMLIMAPFYDIPTKYRTETEADVHPELTELADPLLRYPRLAHTLLVFLKEAPSDTGTEVLFSLIVDLITVFMARSGYSEPLKNILEVLIHDQPVSSSSSFREGPMANYFPKLIPSIEQYFNVCLSRHLCASGRKSDYSPTAC